MDEQGDPISTLLRTSHTIAVVGLSAKPERPSHNVAHYLQAQGYRIIPVNPTYAGTHIHGEYCYPSLKEAAAALSRDGIHIDIVDCFRRAEQIGPVVDEAIVIQARCVWMQLGITDQRAAEKAEAAGLFVVMNKCINIEHSVRLSHVQ